MTDAQEVRETTNSLRSMLIFLVTKCRLLNDSAVADAAAGDIGAVSDVSASCCTDEGLSSLLPAGPWHYWAHRHTKDQQEHRG